MCGIVGLINCGDPERLSHATEVICHRGPDNQGTEWFDPIRSGLGHRRLSIIDLSEAANQPMASADGRYRIVFNGEIYNYREIARELEKYGYTFRTTSDTEVILHSWDKWGEACLEKFNGIFAFAILDIQSGDVFAARDRLGVKPFYYTVIGESLLFASEIKAIIASGIYRPEPDLISIHTPVHFQVHPYTGFKGVFKLAAGNCLQWKNRKLETRQYWKITPTEDRSLPEQEVAGKLDWLLKDSVRLQMIADVPVGVLLSGGLDSSILTALMVRNTHLPVNAFTIKFKEKDRRLQGSVDDSHYARIVAEKFHLKHNVIEIEPDILDLLPKMIWHLDRPVADPSVINTYLISQEAYKNGIKVLINGMGGDEIFSGYRIHLACLKADTYQKYLPGAVRRSIERQASLMHESTQRRNLKYLRWIKSFLAFASLPQMERYMTAYNSALSRENFPHYFANPPMKYEETSYYRRVREYYNNTDVSYLTRICYLDTLIYLPDHNLTYSDKASMAASVEGRPALTDHRLVEFMFSLPPEYRIHGNKQKYILKKVAEKYLPKQIINRPKAAFSVPLRSWLRVELKDMVEELLSERSIKNRGIYSYPFVKTLIENNRKGLADNSQLIFRLMVNELWQRIFFDQHMKPYAAAYPAT